MHPRQESLHGEHKCDIYIIYIYIYIYIILFPKLPIYIYSIFKRSIQFFVEGHGTSPCHHHEDTMNIRIIFTVYIYIYIYMGMGGHARYFCSRIIGWINIGITTNLLRVVELLLVELVLVEICYFTTSSLRFVELPLVLVVYYQ